MSKSPCPACGHQRTAARCWNCDLSDSGERIGFLDLATAVVTTAALQPFVSAIATKAGEEVWPKIAGLVRHGRREEIDACLADTELLEIVARDGRLVIKMPKRLPAQAARDLRDVVATLEKADGRFRISYDAASRSWDITPADQEGGRPEGQSSAT
ncbi:hypothetical protein E4N62_23140 [Streptomyces sp. MNU76]|uniref:hypothetical protein n=1 Tax=Streptomyces sp. MNU76 TaxID=2560026 RepID=UPI001E478CB2|nr:hypothetical protein [Streptomyces sp. MNU76]MCC9707901.1 hypothetical protein [Streptomyces sp. MNU76]